MSFMSIAKPLMVKTQAKATAQKCPTTEGVPYSQPERLKRRWSTTAFKGDGNEGTDSWCAILPRLDAERDEAQRVEWSLS